MFAFKQILLTPGLKRLVLTIDGPACATGLRLAGGAQEVRREWE